MLAHRVDALEGAGTLVRELGGGGGVDEPDGRRGGEADHSGEAEALNADHLGAVDGAMCDAWTRDPQGSRVGLGAL